MSQRRRISEEDIYDAGRIQRHMLRDYVEGKFAGELHLFRARVERIDHIGGQLSGPNTLNPDEDPNPKGAIVARVFTENLDLYTPDEYLRVYWPMFPYDLHPIKETEYVTVMFEDESKSTGVWISRVAAPNGVNNLNLTPGATQYKESTGKAHSDQDRAVQGNLKNTKIKTPIVSENFSKEEVPEFIARTGDRVIQGSNNTIITLSRDRVDSVDSGEMLDAGSVDIVTGREGENVSYENDASRILVSSKSNVDENFSVDAGDPSPPEPHIVTKSDHTRIIARKTHKVVVEDGPTTIVIDSNGININTPGNVNITSNATNIGSSDASHPIVHGDSLKSWLEQVLVNILSSAPVDVAGVPALGLINPAVRAAIQAQMQTFDINVLSSKNKAD